MFTFIQENPLKSAVILVAAAAAGYFLTKQFTNVLGDVVETAAPVAEAVVETVVETVA